MRQVTVRSARLCDITRQTAFGQVSAASDILNNAKFRLRLTQFIYQIQGFLS